MNLQFIIFMQGIYYQRFTGKFANFDDYLPSFYSSRFAIIRVVGSVEKLAK